MFAATSRSSTEPLALVELPSAPLGPRSVRVAVRAAGVNPVDWKMREGGPLRLAWKVLGPPGPLVAGVDFAGEVTEVGREVRTVSPGVRVVGWTDFSRKQRGTYATEVLVDESQCLPLPEKVSYEDAACLPIPGATAWRAFVEYGNLDKRRDARVLVLGASGGVGLAAIQLGRNLGARVWGVCSSRNTALVERLGATAIDYTQGDALEQARAVGPFDVILNVVSTESYPTGRCRALLTGDGVLGLAVQGPRDVPWFLRSPRKVRSVFGEPSRARLAPFVDALAHGAYESVIEQRFPLADAEQAHARSRTGKVVGKLVLVP